MPLPGIIVPMRTLVAAGAACTQQSTSGLTRIGNLTSNGGLAAAFDGTTSVAAASCARATSSPAVQWIGVDWGSGVTKTVCRYIVYGPNNNTFTVGNGGSPRVDLYGSNSSPASGNDGTLLASVACANSGSAEVIDTSAGITETTAYRYHWISSQNSVADMGIAELVLYARS